MTPNGVQGRRDVASRGSRGALLFIILLAFAPFARAETLSLHELLGTVDRALDILMAEADVAGAEADYKREKAEEGWKLGVTAGYGTTRDIIDEVRTRDYDAIQTKVALSYPLLGAYAKEQRKIEMANGKLSLSRIKRDSARRMAQLKLEDVYAAYWGAQESLEVLAAFLGHDGPDDAVARRARSEQRTVARRLEEARRRLEQLTGRDLPKLVALTVQLPKMPPLDLQKLQQEHPELAALRNEYDSTRRQLDDSVWWGVEATFDITQSSITDRRDHQAGNSLFANFNITMPLTFFEAGTQERTRLRAEMEVLELKTKQVGDEIALKAEDAQRAHQDLFDEVEALTRRTQSLGRQLRDPDRFDNEALARRRAEYLDLALDELQARTRYWRSHVEMRSYITVGAAEPAPEPTGPSTTDVGTRLAEPLLRSRRSF